MPADAPKKLPFDYCSQCWKPKAWCLCPKVTPLRNKKKILILQHPQESKEPLSTARLLSLALENSRHRIGLSWRSLSHAWGTEAQPNHWAVLYVGTRKKNQAPAEEMGATSLWKRGKKVASPDWNAIEGIVLLDGNWKQSKTLWWRNPWLNRMPRLLLKPRQFSSYHQLRKQPRGECLSTLEAASESLYTLNESTQITNPLNALLKLFIETVSFSSSEDAKK